MDDHDKLILLTYPLVSKAYDLAMREVEDPMVVFGAFMGYMAKEFIKYGYKHEDWKEFLYLISESEAFPREPEPSKSSKPKLKLVK